jgi:hypothetical protein
MGQLFKNISVPNIQLVLYGLAIRSPGKAKSLVQSFTFPLSPSALNKEYTTLSTIYETAGPASSAGVQRSVDQYGNTQPVFTIQGTTGWQRHGTDGFGFTGLQSATALQAFMTSYAVLNQQQATNNIPDLYTMEFYDYFSSQFWQIEPVGRQAITQDASQPLLFRYSFRWAAIKKLSEPSPFLFDPILFTFQTPAFIAATAIGASLTFSLNAYGGSVGLSAGGALGL